MINEFEMDKKIIEWLTSYGVSVRESISVLQLAKKLDISITEAFYRLEETRLSMATSSYAKYKSYPLHKPAEDQSVLALCLTSTYSNDLPIRAYYIEGEFLGMDEPHSIPLKVTHWCEFPELPKNDQLNK